MRTIRFRFSGGSAGGSEATGGANRSISTAHLDPILKMWLATHYGTKGRRFHLEPTGPDEIQELYEVVGRAENDEEIVVEAEYVADPEGRES